LLDVRLDVVEDRERFDMVTSLEIRDGDREPGYDLLSEGLRESVPGLPNQIGSLVRAVPEAWESVLGRSAEVCFSAFVLLCVWIRLWKNYGSSLWKQEQDAANGSKLPFDAF
jgi:hypothetical protein